MNEAIACSFSRGACPRASTSRSPPASRPSARGRACRAPRPWSRSSGRRARRRRPPRRRCRRRGSAWKPWRAKTRTAASRIWRRLSAAAWLRLVVAAIRRPACGQPAAVGQRRQLARGSAPGASRSRSATTWPSASGACASTTPQGSTIIERPPERMPPRVLADLVGRDHERLVLDRAGADQHLPVVARRRQREGGRHEQDARARARRGSGRARGSAGRSRSTGPARRRRRSRESTISSPGSSARTRGRSCRRRPRRTCGSCGRPP